MDLGERKLPRRRWNGLMSACHLRHGLVWTDGYSVTLQKIDTSFGNTTRKSTTQLGTFRDVVSTHWSCDISPTLCYLCIVQQQSVSIWEVANQDSEPIPSFKEIRRITQTTIPQGCLWNPLNSTLALLSQNQCNFYTKHKDKKGKNAVVNKGKISCGCWSNNGNTFVLVVGNSLHVYHWSSISSEIDSFTSYEWSAPCLSSKILSIAALQINTSTIAVTTERPVDILATPKIDIFQANDSFQQKTAAISLLEDEDDIIRPKSSPTLSCTEMLFNVSRNVKDVTKSSSKLVMINLQEKEKTASIISTIDLECLSMPDILISHTATQSLIVGSNNSNVLCVVQTSQSQLEVRKTIKLSREDKAKGLSESLPNLSLDDTDVNSPGVLVLSGRTKQGEDPTFLPSSTESEYDLKLDFVPLNTSDTASLPPQEEESNSETEEMAESNSASLPLQKLADAIAKRKEAKRIEKQTKENKRKEKKLSKALKTQSVPDMATKLETLDSNASELFNLSEGNGSTLDMALPGAKPTSKVVITGDKSEIDGSPLDISTSDFKDSAPSFKNSAAVKKMMEEKDAANLSMKLSEWARKRKELQQNKKAPIDLDTSLSPHSSVDHEMTFQQPGSGESRESNIRNLSTQNLYSKQELLCLENSIDVQMASIENQIQRQNNEMIKLKERIEDISETLDKHEKSETEAYKPFASPDVVHLVLKNDNLEEENMKKSFILDKGRLQLEVVKQAFEISQVEIYIDDNACVVGANPDGYIPLKFEPNSTVNISGKKTLQIGHPKSSLC